MLHIVKHVAIPQPVYSEREREPLGYDQEYYVRTRLSTAGCGL